MKFIFLLLALPLVNQKCNKAKESVPACIQQKINAIKKEPKWNPPAEVNEYIYMKANKYSCFQAPAAISTIICMIRSVILFVLPRVDIPGRAIINARNFWQRQHMFALYGKIIAKKQRVLVLTKTLLFSFVVPFAGITQIRYLRVYSQIT